MPELVGEQRVETNAQETERLKLLTRARPKRPKVTLDGTRLIVGVEANEGSMDVNSARLSEALGTRSGEFVETAMFQLSAALRRTGNEETDAAAISAALAVVASVEPSNEAEAVLALQIGVANSLAMNAFARASNTNHLEAMKAYSAIGTKAMRTCALSVGSSRVDLQACKLEYSIVSPK